MKRFYSLSATLLALACTVASCVSEKTDFKQPEKPDGEAVGYLSFDDSGLNVVTDTEIMQMPQARALTAPDVNQFQVDILDSRNTSVLSFKYGEKPTDPIELPVGNYTLNIASGVIPGADWETPVYTATRAVPITRGETTHLGEITCKQANIKVTVGYSADLREELQAGSHTIVTVAPNTLDFALDETRAGYLRAVAATNTMEVEINLVINGSTKRMTTSIPDTKAGQWRKITVRKTQSNEGEVTFTVTVETLTLDEEIVVDVTEQLVEEVLPDPAPAIAMSVGDIAQPYRLAASMFDADGNFTQPFDVTVTCMESTIASLQVGISSTNAEFIASLTQMNITTSFDLCEVNATSNPTLNTALTMIGFPTGGKVLGKQTATFKLQDLMGLLYGFDGTHDFSLAATDAAGRTSQATLSIIVDKSGDTPAEGPSIVWRGNDIDQTYEVTSDLTVQIDVKAPSGIAGFVVDIDSDVLTADILQGMTLDKHIDLIEPGAMEAMLSTPYPEGLGFPVKDAVRNQTDLLFDISNFMSMILDLGMPGYFNFKLTVTDNNGNTTIKTVKLIVSNK